MNKLNVNKSFRHFLTLILSVICVILFSFNITNASSFVMELHSKYISNFESTENNTNVDSYDLNPTKYTSKNYIPPSYDPFNNKFRPFNEFLEKIENSDRGSNTPPTAKFHIRTKQNGIADNESGTLDTDFIFDAFSSYDSETKNSNLLVRWDFGDENTYFSKSKRATHKFSKSGVYKVTLEVMDNGGLIDSTFKYVTVVNNTIPFAHFRVFPSSGTLGQIFTFDTSKSSDSQYLDSNLEYRFDWDGDGLWDTPFERKRLWTHQFNKIGTNKVFMEVKDPEGLTAKYFTVVNVFENSPPVANFSIKKSDTKMYSNNIFNDELGKNYKTEYIFDASLSTDKESTDNLKYRWDFNYTGSDDINFNTNWQNSPFSKGHYDFSGEKIIRLQVMDEDGAISNSFAKINVE